MPKGKALPLHEFLTGGLTHGTIEVLAATNCSYDFNGKGAARPCLRLTLKDESDRDSVQQYWPWGFFTAVWPSADAETPATTDDGECGEGPFIIPVKDNVTGIFGDSDAAFMLHHLFAQCPEAKKRLAEEGDVRSLVGLKAAEGVQLGKKYTTSDGVEKSTNILCFINPTFGEGKAAAGKADATSDTKKDTTDTTGGGDKAEKIAEALKKGIEIAVSKADEGIALTDLPSAVFEALTGKAAVPIKSGAKKAAHDADTVAAVAKELGLTIDEGTIFKAE